MRVTESMLKTLCVSSNSPRCFSMQNSLKDHVIKFNLSYRARFLLTLMGRGFSMLLLFFCLLLFVCALLEWLRVENNNIKERKKKVKQHFLTGTNSCQRDSAVKTKCSAVLNRDGETSFVFWYLTPVRMRNKAEAVTELG